MKITSIDLYSNNAKAASFSFRDPASNNPYIVEAMTGLDADEIVPKSYGLSYLRQYGLAQLKRTIVLKITLNPNFSQGKTASDLRDDLYRTIYSSRTGQVELKFNNGSSGICGFIGFVGKFEAPMFNKTSQVQLTINSDEGMLYGLEEVIVNPLLLGLNEQKFSIEDNVSTAPHGFSMRLTFTENSTNFYMVDASAPATAFEVVPGVVGGLTGFQAGDQVYFSSNVGGKEFFIIRGMGNIYSLIDKINIVDNTWPIMFPRENTYTLSCNGDYEWGTITYFTSFWGI